MPTFVEKYTDAQRDAVAEGYEDRKIRPMRKVLALAAAGELEHQGEQLEPFTMPDGTARDLVRDLRKKRAGKKSSALADLPHRDAVEQLRRRLISGADLMLADWEKRAKRNPEKADAERHRQITRCAREAAALPTREAAAPRAPGAKEDGKRTGAQTTGGMGGAILAAHRTDSGGVYTPQEEAAPSVPSHDGGEQDQDAGGEHERSAAAHDESEAETDAPGALARTLAHRAGVQLAEA